jgi:hypothetical protein
MKTKPSKKSRTTQQLTARQKKELAALAALPDDKIDKSEMPEVRDWSNAKRGLFYRYAKQRDTS